MAITGKQVRQLRSMANNLKPTVIVGKEGVTANILKQVNEGLEAHELIKVSVLCETGSQAAEAGREIADQAEAELVQVIGKRVVLYRETTRDDIEKIQLVSKLILLRIVKGPDSTTRPLVFVFADNSRV